MPGQAAHTNRQLFSNHFLEVRLREDDLWEDVAEPAEELRARLRERYRDQRDALRGSNEPQTEDRWVRPVLGTMGWGYEVQPVSKRHGTTQFPDYALFLDQQKADAAASAPDRRTVLKRAATVLEAKRWQRNLDAGDPDEAAHLNQVPSTQIINYLIRAEQPWGILTNGVEWRLYHRDADFADTTYFAVDLPALLGDAPLTVGEKGEEIPAAEAFRYFYLFFRPEAYRVEAEGKRWLDLAKEASVRYARAVEEALKPRAYRAVAALCRGFAAAHDIDPSDLEENPDLAKVVLDNALTLLFRLLFLLYGESRDLLPVRTNAAYRQKSLLQLRERAAAARDSGTSQFPKGRDFWNDLHDLFRIVDGDPAWRAIGIPVYNGGLFDPDEHRWLEDHYVADPHLAEAMDLLSRSEDPETGRMHYVDYGPLDVRNLGSIYEGLLEYELRIAPEDLPAIRERGRTARDPVEAGELYLADEKGERKTTGSYYTPHYVVEYIVDRTLAPLIEDRNPEEILGLEVLDPAMGSGHFLVSATAYLARAATRAVEEEQGGLGDLAQLDPDHLRRLVVERCIFGVDKNPRAVELAKLSLWIATVQKDKPLNFLDHHLKCGDSLLGARIHGLGRLPEAGGKKAAMEAAGQVDAFESAFQAELTGILDSILAIESTASDTLTDVKRKESLYRRAEALIGRFRRVADLWCGTLLGNAIDGDRYARALTALHGYPGEWDEIAEEDWMREAERIAGSHRFFHWDLEFSEVFYEEDGSQKDDAGFDAVIGNPPYVRMEAFKEIKDFLRVVYESYDTRTDLYVYFIERSLELLRDGGEFGMIVSNKFLRAKYGRKIRGLIGREGRVREIVDFGELPVFEEAATMPALFFVVCGEGNGNPRFAQLTSLKFDTLEKEIDRLAFEVDPSSVRGEDWVIVPRDVRRILEKIESYGQALAAHVNGQIYYGIKTGLNDAFFIDNETRERLIAEDPKSAEVIKPLVVGTEIRRYRLERQGLSLLYLPHGTAISRYPAIRRYLAPFKERLEKRATKQAWYELQQPQEAYHAHYESPKILYPIIAMSARFAFDEDKLYPNDKSFCIPSESGYLLAVLNSRLSFFYLEQICSVLGDPAKGGRLELRAQYMERLPVPRIEETTPPDARRELGAWLRSLYFRGLRLDGIEPDLPDDIRKLGERVGALEGVEQVILVGSWARGEAREDSDVDLVVIGLPDGSRAQRRLAIRRHVGEFPRGIDIHVYTPQEARHESSSGASFLGHVLSEGVVLYDGE